MRRRRLRTVRLPREHRVEHPQHPLDARERRPTLPVLEDRPAHARDDRCPVLDVRPVDDERTRQVERVPRRRDVRVRERDEVRGARVRALDTTRTEQVLERVPATLGLPDGVDAVPGVARALPPHAVLTGDDAALDLEHRDTDTGPCDDEIELAFGLAVLDALTGDEQRVVGQVGAQRFPHGTLGAAVVRELGLVRQKDGHGPIQPVTQRDS